LRMINPSLSPEKREPFVHQPLDDSKQFRILIRSVMFYISKKLLNVTLGKTF
jgi:hypothetical protein